MHPIPIDTTLTPHEGTVTACDVRPESEGSDAR